MNFAKTAIDQSLSVVIPAYNDEQTIGLVIGEADAIAKTIAEDYEILVIDDGSADGTRQVVATIALTNDKVKLRTHPQNLGYGATIKELYLTATKDLVFSCPGDGQIPPAQLLKMIPALRNFDLVVGYRKKRMDGIIRGIQTAVYNTLVRCLYRIDTRDINSVKLFRKKIMNGTTFLSDSPFIDAELCIRARKMGFRVGEVVIEHLPRKFNRNHGGKSSIILSTILDVIKYVRLTERS